MHGKNQVITICREMPLAMVKFWGRKARYRFNEIDSVWNKKFQTRHNIKFAYAMFFGYSDNDVAIAPEQYGLQQIVANLCLGEGQAYSLDAILAYARAETVDN